MKKILILFLLLVNLHIITDNGILCVGIGGLSAQTMLEEQLDDVVVTGSTSVDCEWCRMTVLKSQLEFHQQSECPARPIECLACHKVYKAYEGHVCSGLRCSICGNDASSCKCGPVVEGNNPSNDPGGSKPGGGYVGGGTNTTGSQSTALYNKRVADYATAHISRNRFGEGKCARFVFLAIYNGDWNKPRPRSAKDSGPLLEKMGYIEVENDMTFKKAQVGDIRVWEAIPNKHKDGHIDIFNGKNWVSDFIELYPNGCGPAYREKGKFKTYRKK